MAYAVVVTFPVHMIADQKFPFDFQNATLHKPYSLGLETGDANDIQNRQVGHNILSVGTSRSSLETEVKNWAWVSIK